MKTKILFTIGLFFISIVSFSQVFENVDYISPENQGIIAIKKGEEWSFIDTMGNTLVDFRNDLVVISNSDGKYPLMVNNRCLIKKKVDDMFLYGFIDKSGTLVIEPQFVYATSFKDGKAIILKKITEKIGENKVLGKNVISTKLEEYVIDTSGKTIKFLSSRNYIPKRVGAKSQLKINSKFISNNIIGVKDRNNKWILYKI
ncbi:MAG: WG repeat-containing protein [Flavobacteriaceae bacterium]|nr:WG repeat-containing protein [Flavobacteriaceae bacterium]